jgi:ABC-type bacteriocin/lantibiotic exporter with double-glycine peptidase domain
VPRKGIVFIAALAIAGHARSLWLDVPFVRQEKNGCGAACAAMLSRYWKTHGASRIRDRNAAEIQRNLYSPEARGIFGADLEQYLKDAGFRVFVFRGDWGELSAHLAKGRPLIACLGADSHGYRHYVIVAGVDDSNNVVLVNDPARRKLAMLDRKDFEKDWSVTGYWTLLAVPLESQ